MDSCLDLYGKTKAVVDSCKTEKQYESAYRYYKLASAELDRVGCSGVVTILMDRLLNKILSEVDVWKL